MGLGRALLGTSCGDPQTLGGLRGLDLDISDPKLCVSTKELGLVPITKGKKNHGRISCWEEP